MNIAFFTDTYLPNSDGVVNSIILLRKRFELKGHKVFIFCPGSKKQKIQNKDDHVYYFTSTIFKPYPDYRIALFPFLSAIKRVKENKIDLIHSHGIATTGIAAIQCAKKLKIPSVATFHTMIPDGIHYLTKNSSLQDFLKSVSWKYLRWYYSNFDNVIVPSLNVKKILQSQEIKNLHLIPNGIDCIRFKKGDGSKIRKKLRVLKNPIILTVGRIAQEKNLELIINSANNILNVYPNAKFIIIGKGPAKEYYESLVKSKGLSKNFIFTGFVSDLELPNYYSAADVFAFPSEFDTQGLVILESLSANTPVVVKSNSAPAEIIKDSYNGYVFNDHFDFSQKIICAIKNNALLKENIKKEKNDFSIENSSQKILNLYNSMISSP
jgi:1,2-diacylglycerol 3-alpha-glucosyltransferase